MDTAAAEEGPEFERVRSLLERAMEQPAELREAWVREQAGAEAALRERVLALLREAHMGGTDALREGLRAALGAATDASGGDAVGIGDSNAGERVQSTATGELLDKLKTAPKLDGERFVLEGELGQGGMGVVMKIHDRFLNRRLAMKVLLERRPPRDEEEQKLAHQLLGRFLEEAQVTSQLDHPGVVPVHELGLDAAGKVWFTMRMVKGRTADQVFRDCHRGDGEWDLVRGLEIALKVCDTMAYSHDKGVLHRDLKPSNVMVGRFGEVYVMDWGLAKVLGQQDRHDLRIRKDQGTGASVIDSTRLRDAETDAQNSVVTMDGQQLGTPSYMSPEQAKSGEVDVRADVYSIGAMLYELVTGRAPYTVSGARQPAYRILNDVLDGPPKRIEDVQKGVPAELVAIIDKAMARDREQRYRDVMALAADVRAFVSHRAVQAYRTGPIVELQLWVRRNKALAASLAAAAVLLVLGITFVSLYADEARQSARVAQQSAIEANEAREHAQQQQRLAQQNAQLAEQRAAAEQQAKQVAAAKATALAAKVAEFDQLALVVDYDRLLQEEGMLGPGFPDQEAAIADWLRRANALLALRNELPTVIAAVEQGQGGNGADGTSPAAAQFLATSLRDLVQKLPKLEALVPDMESRSRWAKAVVDLTLHHPNATVTWDEARKAVALSPKYAGQDIPLRDRDVRGLVPIGENPQSGLWEFYDLRSAWDGKGDPADLAKLPIPKQAPDGRIEVTGDTGIVWVLLPGGTLPRGTIDEGNLDETSVRLGVRLDPFFLGKHEVTRGQWKRWTGSAPETWGGDDNDFALPVASVSWYTCHDTLARFGLVLPSELQWEYGIRGGTTTTWWTGDDQQGVVAAENVGRDRGVPFRVGSNSPNQFGVFDMAGNVLEWISDEWASYGTERLGHGLRPDSEEEPQLRCTRGGIFDWEPETARSDWRQPHQAAAHIIYLGLRAARTCRR